MKSFSKLGWWLAAACCLLLMGAPGAWAQRPAPPDGNRFLLVVDTASVMRSSSNGVEQSVFELFKSGMKGEFRPGDTIGFWTYNNELHADLPMQTWTEADGQRIAESIVTVLREQGYHGRARLGKAMSGIKEVVTKSRRLTIVLIYDGQEPVSGTPYDNDINSLLKQFGRKFRDEHTPFVVALAAKDGRIFDYSVNTPGSISIPHTALPWPPPVTNAPPPAVVEAAPVAPPPPPPPPAHHYTQIVMSGHNAVPAGNTASPSPTPVDANQIVANAATNVAVVPAPPPASNAALPETGVVSAPPAAKEPEPAPVAATPEPAPPPAPAPREEKKLAATSAVAEAPVATNAAPPVASTSIPPASSPPSPPPSRSVEATALPATPLPPTPAVAAAPHDNAEEVALFIIAFSLLAIAVSLIWYLARRGRAAGSPSLISQSMDRPR